ncbi:hypothetical protein [Mycolicibacterium hippocampi]|uniref:Uncharacterized protein n=1 Tax=Mycolicibacterium hippocampi TaxID=659824 RepID=A0A7I9ZQD8_9MYCO|nr:hypothetical protein [Mycolicibacterium hippocampi]GFH02993.1 hypothetical protein MHIP_34760 [Mycolicibacterium hippocampi]
MPTEVVVAIIAVCGVVLTQVVTYAISRQNANDLRANIDREVDIIGKLQPTSDEAKKLEAHVRASIGKLIHRDERREQLVDIIWTFAPLFLVSSMLLGLQWWRQRGVPEVIGPGVAVVYYGLFAFWVLLALRYLWQSARLIYSLAKILFGYMRLSWTWVRISRMWIRSVFLKRRNRKTKERLGAVIDIAQDLLDTLDEYPDTGDEGMRAAREQAGEKAARRLADVGITLKSRPIPHY